MNKKITITLIFFLILVLGFFSNYSTNRTNEYVFNVNNSICFSVLGDFRDNFTIAKRMLWVAANDSNYLILTGDYATVPSDEIFSNFFNVIMKIENKSHHMFFFIPGNHDVLRGYQLYYKHFNANNFIIKLNFDEKTLFLLGLDNARGYFIDLSALKLYGKKIIFAHHPIYDTYENRCNYCNLIDLFKKSNVILYVASHVHGWDVKVINGLLQIISAGAGAKFRPFHDNREKYNYLKMCIYDHIIDLRLKDINGTTFWMKKVYW